MRFYCHFLTGPIHKSSSYSVEGPVDLMLQLFSPPSYLSWFLLILIQIILAPRSPIITGTKTGKSVPYYKELTA